MARKAMLLKVVVQTIWVEVDDDGAVEERIGGSVAVSASDWPGFYEAWRREFEQLQASVATPAIPTLNRAQRRAKAPANGA